MNCANHPDVVAAAYCRACGKPLCLACQRTALGTVYCEEHLPVEAAAPAAAPASAAYSPYTSPYIPPPPGTPSAGLAFLLGLIPGVGAIYNGQYAKGLFHVVILGLLISILNSGAAEGLLPLFSMLAGLWCIYMPFEAYHTAAKRQRGEPVDEFSSIFPLEQQTGLPVGPMVMIMIGIVFLLNTLEIVRLYQILRWWPVLLILLGVYLMVARGRHERSRPVDVQEAANER